MPTCYLSWRSSQKCPHHSTCTGFIDLYKSACLLSETKQGTFSKAAKEGTLLDFIPNKASKKTGHGKRGTAAFDKVLQRAYHQARKYITALPASEGRPPFLIVCDVGHSIDLYAEFSGTGGHYERFPDPASFRIYHAWTVPRRWRIGLAKGAGNTKRTHPNAVERP